MSRGCASVPGRCPEAQAPELSRKWFPGIWEGRRPAPHPWQVRSRSDGGRSCSVQGCSGIGDRATESSPEPYKKTPPQSAYRAIVPGSNASPPDANPADGKPLPRSPRSDHRRMKATPIEWWWRSAEHGSGGSGGFAVRGCLEGSCWGAKRKRKKPKGSPECTSKLPRPVIGRHSVARQMPVTISVYSILSGGSRAQSVLNHSKVRKALPSLTRRVTADTLRMVHFSQKRRPERNLVSDRKIK